MKFVLTPEEVSEIIARHVAHAAGYNATKGKWTAGVALRADGSAEVDLTFVDESKPLGEVEKKSE
jgi:hypothetical protein